MNNIQKTYRFVWRLLVNVACTTVIGRRRLFPPDQLSTSFGRGDAEYAWQIYLNHFWQLRHNGFDHAHRLLEVGPGRNLGTSLLWWCYLSGRSNVPVEIVCWDVFKNVNPDVSEFWPSLAKELLGTIPCVADESSLEPFCSLIEKLKNIAGGGGHGVHYYVMSMDELMQKKCEFDLVYSQAAIEHIWFIERFWEDIALLTQDGGWHSHRIDLADHGRRDTNYIELLQWSEAAYWLTQRFIPGSLNRWRASDHLNKMKALGFTVLRMKRDIRDVLPIQRRALAKPFRTREEDDLRTTGLELVSRKIN